MSSRRGTQHLKRRRGLSHFIPPKPGEQVDYATHIGAAASRADLPDAHRVTHDALIRELGPRRRGGVSWLDIPASEAPEFLAEERATALSTELAHGATNRTVAEAEAALDAFLAANPHGFLVVAMCEAVR